MDAQSKKKVKFIFNVVDRAEVKMVDFATLTGIRRETLHRWKSGANIKDQLRLNTAYAFALRLNTALENKVLPLTDKLKRAERIATLRRITHPKKV